jgi:hypothetical protein
MRARLAAFSVIALLDGVAAGDGYDNPTVGRELALQVPGMHRVVVKKNVVYARRGGRALALDVYRPRGARADQRHDARSRAIQRQAIASVRAQVS